MNEIQVAVLDQLFQSRNDVLFAREFVDDVAEMEFPVSLAGKVPKFESHKRITDAAAAVIYQWTAQELQFFFGSARNVVGADARKIELHKCWIVSVELVQLLGQSVSIVFHFDENAQVVRVLAAMPTSWDSIVPLFRFKIDRAKERLARQLSAEMVDAVARKNRLAKSLV